MTDRFELFVGGRELANGYSELNDPVRQRGRCSRPRWQRLPPTATSRLSCTVDEDYLRALEFGLPPTGGLGIGIDRVAMLLSGQGVSIREVILFPTLRPEVPNMTRMAWGAGFTTEAADGTTLDAWYRWLGWGEYGEEAPEEVDAALAGGERRDAVRRVIVRPIRLTVDVDDAPSSAADAYLRLHLLSDRLAAPHSMNLDGIFGALQTVAWTDLGPVAPGKLDEGQLADAGEGRTLLVHGPDNPADARLRGAFWSADRRRQPGAAGCPPGRGHGGDARGLLQLQRRHARHGDGRGSDQPRGHRRRGLRHRRWGVDHGHVVRRRTEQVTIGERCLVGANGGIGISLGDDCVVEAGLYVTAGTLVRLPDGQVVKGRELSGVSGMMFIRHSQTGAVEARQRQGTWGGLNQALH